MITIIKATKRDAKDLLDAKIDAFSWDVNVYGYGPPGFDSYEQQSKMFENENVRYFKILDDATLIGGICVFAHDDKHYRLGVLYIVAAYQNKGIGSIAMEFLFKEFADAGKWTLDTPYRSFRNHHFYEKHGFIKVGETQPEDDGFYLYLYEKRNGK